MERAPVKEVGKSDKKPEPERDEIEVNSYEVNSYDLPQHLILLQG